MLIIGIDPASRKNAYVKIELHGSPDEWTFVHMEAPEVVCPTKLNSLLKEWQKNGDALLIWDAPLTGPQNPPDYGPNNDSKFVWSEGDFSRRILEQHLEKTIIEKERNLRPNLLEKRITLPGISIKHYTGCSHWAITRALLGLPRIGRFDANVESLPFKPVFEDSDLRRMSDEVFRSQRCVVETHPAVALWCWLHNHTSMENLSSWKYKGTNDKGGSPFHKEQRKKMLSVLRSIWEKAFPNIEPQLKTITDAQSKFINDDNCFDALIAGMLGLLYITQCNVVKLYGNQKEGAMLLPQIDHLMKPLASFTERHFTGKR